MNEEATAHQVQRLTSIVNDKIASLSREQIQVPPVQLALKQEAMFFEMEVLKEMLFGPGGPFEGRDLEHARDVLSRLNELLDRTHAELARARLLAL